MSKIGVIGTGYVGLITALCLAKHPHHKVMCCDIDKEKIEKLQSGIPTIYEEGINELLNEVKDRVTFTSNTKELVEQCDTIFITTGTPTVKSVNNPGKVDITSVMAPALQVGAYAKDEKIVVVKSTVPVGTCNKIQKIYNEKNQPHTVLSNPEFLREGRAIQDFLEPDRVVIGYGTGGESEAIRLSTLYDKVLEGTNNFKGYLFVSRESAELIKYASNTFLAMKISYINEVANICEETGANIEEVREGMITDHRIGEHFLQPGPGYGGSCFPKDVQGLIYTAQEYHAFSNLAKATHTFNKLRVKNYLAYRFRSANVVLKNLKVTILGAAFKPGTDDIRESAALPLIDYLYTRNAIITINDPYAVDNINKWLLRNGYYGCKASNNLHESLKDAEVVFIVTDHDEYREIDWNDYKCGTVMDSRNLFSLQDMSIIDGMKYISVGRPTVVGAKK
jgi:UDPglucose 6-dehydrogenase